MPTRLICCVSFVLLIVFFFNVCAFGVVLSAQLFVHQQEQQDKIKNKKHKEIIELRINRELVEVNNSEFQWLKNWEFRWHGEMYDIENTFIEGDEYVFSVKHDSEEDILRKNLERHAQDETTQRNKQLKKNLKCGSEFFQRVEFSILNSPPIPFRTTQTLLIPVQGHREIQDPPPWNI